MSSRPDPEVIRGAPALRRDALRRSQEQRDLVLLDPRIDPGAFDWIAVLQKAAYSRPDIGIAGCRLVSRDGRLQHAGLRVLSDTLEVVPIGAGERDVYQFGRRRDVPAVSFEAAYLRRDAIVAVGGFSEEISPGFDEVDFCLRAREAGYSVICAGDVSLSLTNDEGFASSNRRPDSRFRRRWERTLSARYRFDVHWQSILNISTGYATSGREILRGLDRAGIRMSYSYLYGPGTPLPYLEPGESGDAELNMIVRRKSSARPEIAVAYGFGNVLRKNRGRYRIGYTMLEVDGFPDEWVEQCNEMDEVWTPSHFNRDGLLRSGVRKPIHVMPLGVDTAHFNPQIRAHRNPAGDFVFFANFEWGERKAPELLLQSFNRTFRREEPVLLLCKVFNRDGGLAVRNEIERLALRESGGRIEFLFNREIPYAELGSLYRSADCFISSGLGEGWDMPLAEAMACGLPSIATDWGPHRDYLHDGNSYPIRIRGTVPAVALCPYYDGFAWADPDPDHFSQLLRHVFSHREEAAAKGDVAAREMEVMWSAESTASRIAQRLTEIAADPDAARKAGRAAIPRTRNPVVAIDVSRAIGHEISGVGVYAQNVVAGLGRFGPEDLDFLLLPGFGTFVHPDYGSRLRFAAPTSPRMHLYRGPLPAYGNERAPIEGVRLVHSTAYAAPQAVRVPLLVTVQDLTFLTHPEFHTDENILFCSTHLNAAIARGADLLAGSANTKTDMLRQLHVSAEKIHVVHNTFDPERFHPFSAEEKSRVRGKYQLPERFFLFVGSVEPRKNLATILAAHARLKSPIPLVIAGGSGWLNSSLRERIRGASGPVISIGYISRHDLGPLYAAAHAVLYPSIYEGFGLPVLEAMACGTSVITTRVSSLPEVGGDAAILLDDPLDAQVMALEMERLAGDDVQRRRLAELGIEQAKKFSLEKTTRELIALYRELME